MKTGSANKAIEIFKISSSKCLPNKDFTLIRDGSFFYTGITNLDLRLKADFNVGQRGTEYGEKRNDHRVEFRVRYYFDATKLIDWIK